MTDDDGEHTPRDGEVLPPENIEAKADDTGLSQAFMAFVSNYTDRPDLLIAEIEKHDPGFVKRMNAAAEKDSAELRAARFSFGKHQAYSALVVSVIAAISMLGAVFYALSKGAGFWTLIGIGAIYGISQGGSRGFSRLAEAVSDLIGRIKGEAPKE